MDYESASKKIIGEALSVYDGFNDKRSTVIHEIAKALQAAYEAGAEDERARAVEKAKSAAMAGLAEEREACAKVAEAFKSQDAIEVFARMENAVAVKIAQSIRSRSVPGSVSPQSPS